MVKRLGDLCLICIQTNLKSVTHLDGLPYLFKEILIERLAFHDLLTASNIPHVYRHLFVNSLRRLNFFKCRQLDDKLLKSLAKSNCKLISLTINACIDVTDAGIIAITKNQKELEELTLKALPHLTAAGVHHVRSDHLISLSLKNCHSIIAPGLVQVIKNNPNIATLCLGGTSCDTRVYTAIADNLGPRLQHLECQLGMIHDGDLEILSRGCTKILVLNLEGCVHITGQGLLHICRRCTDLLELNLSHCGEIHHYPDALWTLPQKLHSLSLSGVLVKNGDILVESLQRLTRLSTLVLNGVPTLNDAVLTQLLSLVGSRLHSLDIGWQPNAEITDKTAAAISEHCVNLRSLSLWLLDNMTCQALAPLFHDTARAGRLEELRLCRKQLDGDVLTLFSENCYNLRHLDESGLRPIDDDFVKTVASKLLSLH